MLNYILCRMIFISLLVAGLMSCAQAEPPNAATHAL